MQVPQSANDDSPPQRPLPPVDPKFLLMAAAGMQQAKSAYDPGATFSDTELSRNIEDRRGFTEMDNLAAAVGMVLQNKAKSGSTDRGYDTSTTPAEDTGPMGRMNPGTTPR